MNPRQRRGLVMLVLAALGACAVFLGVASYVAQVNAEVGPRTKVYVAARDIPPFAAVTPQDLRTVEIPTKYVTDTTVTREADFLGQKTFTTVKSGSYLTSEMMTSSSSLSDGMREVSINFDAADGINGRVRPGDKVDVVAAFAARQSSQNQVDQSVRKAQLPYNVAGIVVSQALVVSVGEKTPVGIEVGAATDGNADPQEVVPVTFALSVKDSTALAYAEAFSVKMRIMRSGNNESGKKVTPDARSFNDTRLPPLLQETVTAPPTGKGADKKTAEPASTDGRGSGTQRDTEAAGSSR
ncbi:Flp pilus assembly protein CpaB [Angustibacter aerolatus]